VPGDWEVVDQSAGPNLTWSQSNEAWVSTADLAPGESMNVSATFRLPNRTAPSVYRVSARGFDAAGDSATAVEEFPVGSFGDEPLTLSASAAESVRPGENVTMTLSLRNDGDNDTVAPAIDLTGIPSGWAVLNHSGPANATWSQSNEAWVSTETLAPGESMNVTVLLGTSRESSVGPYFVSARGYGANGEQTAASVRVELAGEPVPETTQTTAATTSADAEATTAAEGETTAAADETTAPADEGTTAAADETTAESAETTTGQGEAGTDGETTVETTTGDATTTGSETTAEVSATFAVEGERNVTVSLEVADDAEERRQGLMFRESLPRNHGMVFVYDEAETRTFWMKNTLIPLDMVFVASNGTVLNVEHARVQPDASDSELARYSSDGEARYVVELNRGFANRTGVGPGTQVTFDGLNATTTQPTAAA
jgi:hypothetical protein